MIIQDESHKYYEYFRTYFAGKLDEVEQRMALLEEMEEMLDVEKDVKSNLETALLSREEEKLKQWVELMKVIGDSTWRTLFSRRLLELHPYNHEYQFELGQALKESMEYVEALSWLQKCLAYRNVHCHLDNEAADECYDELATTLRGMDFDEGATLVETESMIVYAATYSPTEAVAAIIKMFLRQRGGLAFVVQNTSAS